MLDKSIANESLNEPDAIINIELRPGESITKSIKVKQPPFHKVGRKSMNILHILSDLNRNSLKMFAMLADIQSNNYNEYGRHKFILKLSPKDTVEKAIVKNGYNGLLDSNLIVRIKRGHFMINPKAIISSVSHEEHTMFWTAFHDEVDIFNDDEVSKYNKKFVMPRDKLEPKT